RTIAVDRNDFHRQATNGRRQTGSGIRNGVDFTRHKARDSNLSGPNHQSLQLESLIFEETVLLAVIKRRVADRKPGRHDDEFLGAGTQLRRKYESKKQKKRNNTFRDIHRASEKLHTSSEI